MKKSALQNNIRTDYLIAERIICSQNCENAELLLADRPRQAILGQTENIVTLMKGGFIVLDFGTELHGGIILAVLKALPQANIHVVFGESVSEAMSSIGEKNSTNDHSFRDILLPVTSLQTVRIGKTGFRFVKLEADETNIELSCVQAAFEYIPLDYAGSFECNDEILTKIWNVGAYTVHLNMQDFLWDGIKRDRLVWVGDMHPETSTIAAVFGDVDVVRNSLDLIRFSTPANRWINTMPSYSLWYLKIQYDLYLQTGRLDYLTTQKQYIFDTISHILSCINNDGTVNVDNKFVEWSSRGTDSEAAGFQAILTIGLKAAALLCQALNNSKLEKECRLLIPLVMSHTYKFDTNKQIAAMVSLADMADSRKISDEILKRNCAHGISAFWGFYTLQALAKSGDMQSALDIIRLYWGKMLEFGATTFWEDFDIDWAENSARIDEIVPEGKNDIHGDFGCFCYKQFRHSLCHGWSSGPTAFLSRFILGIEPLEPGFKKVRIVPNLADLKWVRGSYPTPYGNIEVECADGLVKINAPSEIQVINAY